MTDVTEAEQGSRDRALYGVALLATLALIAWILAGPVTNDSVYFLVIDIFAAALLLATSISAKLKRRYLGLVLLGVVVALVAIIEPLWDVASSQLITSSIALLLVTTYVPVVIAQGLIRRKRVDLQLILGAVTIYLLIGVMGAVILSLAGLVADSPLFTISATAVEPAQVSDGTFRDRTYFSFVTLSTVGYGDISPLSGTARAIAMLTALVGQIYLVVAVAAAVSGVTTRLHAALPQRSIRSS